MNAEAVTMLAAALTAVFTGWAVLQHVVERKRPRILLFIDKIKSEKRDEMTYNVVASNAGTGDALYIKFTAGKNARQYHNAQWGGTLAPGEELSLYVTIPVPGAIPSQVDEKGGVLTRPMPVPKDCDEKIVFTWNQPPYLAVRHRKTRLLRKLKNPNDSL